MPSIRRVLAAVVTGMLSFSLVNGAAPAASSAEHDGGCQGLELCLFYNSGQRGASHDFRYKVPDFGPYAFLGSSAGAGQSVKNHAASAWNLDGYFTARIYFNSGYAGPADDVTPLTRRNLGDTYNDNASFNWCHKQPLVCG
ncbi:peptidase inhibitor family I36 protein [Jiangella mangrovi]|uniref:Peptidase M23 n=1 Tax=Jiangella mangrovi TaxID=1524084 RepID=A0A7W9GR46_9ACTN|nr:hypothetical protein [Jiangella mangrovi]